MREQLSPDALSARRRHGTIVLPGILMGMGLGGFFDGIVLHQMLQWHHLVTALYPPTSLENLQHNTFWDGIFHAASWLWTITGLLLLIRMLRWPERPWSAQNFVGTLLMGWGLFNLIEGVVNHYVLQIHHVRPGPQQWAWDVGFLGWGAIMLVAGWRMMRTTHRTLPQ